MESTESKDKKEEESKTETKSIDTNYYEEPKQSTEETKDVEDTKVEESTEFKDKKEEESNTETERTDTNYDEEPKQSTEETKVVEDTKVEESTESKLLKKGLLEKLRRNLLYLTLRKQK